MKTTGLLQTRRRNEPLSERAMHKMKTTPTSGTGKTGAASTLGNNHALEFHGVRYQVKDVARSIEFYTQKLGFELEHQHLPEFGTVSLGALKIHLSGPGSSGSRLMPGGLRQEPGGWNRVVLRTPGIEACIEGLKQAGVHFRNAMETGPAGKQIQFEDPDGNPIELFEPARRAP